MRSLRDTAELDCFLEADDPIAIGKSMPCVVNESLFDNEHGRIPFLGPRANLEPALLAIAILWVREAASGGRGCSTARLLYCEATLLRGYSTARLLYCEATLLRGLSIGLS